MIDISDKDIDKVEAEIGLIFDEARRDALKSFNDIQACPGSGKTTLIAAKLIVLIKKWEHKYRGICVLSHTNVAKNEIIQRIEKHPQGLMLLKYPHFIGTIQEFVNRFLAIPYCRSNGIPVNQIDDEICCSYIEKTIKSNTKSFLNRNHSPALKGLQYFFQDGVFSLKVPGFKNKSSSDSYQDLENVKHQLRADGYHFYQEMYEYGKAAIASQAALPKAIRYRFPIVFIDEMQDTNKIQDSLIHQLFSQEEGLLQRFGDPDQAIFDGMGELNETYNNATPKAITTSHRFCPDIARLTSGLSLRCLTLESQKKDHTESKSHTIFLVDKDSRQSVIPAFAALCATQTSTKKTYPIKIIGSVGKDNPNGLTLRDYVPSFDKNNSISNFKPSKLIHYFIQKNLIGSYHNNILYNRALEGMSRCIRLTKKKLALSGDKEFFCTRDFLKRWLKETGKIRDFNTLLLSLQTSNIIDQKTWEETCRKLLELLEIEPTLTNIQKFISFEENIGQHKIEPLLLANKYTFADLPIGIEVGTIHSVKGETHAATLVLETKVKRNFDISHVLEYLLQEQEKTPKTKEKKQLIKQLYVAMTRPKYLLCLAIDKSRFTEKNIARATELGWSVVDLCNPSVPHA